MRFLIRFGTHSQDGKVYKKGQTVESPHDLEKFRPAKFKRLPDKKRKPSQNSSGSKGD